MFAIIGWLLFGLIAGAIARFIVPGRDPMGLVGTTALGLAGSVVGGLIGRLVFHSDGVGLIASVLGAVLLLVIFNRTIGQGRDLAR